MHISLRQQLIEETVTLIRRASPLVATIARRDRDLASQIRRALSSVGLNLAEGFGNAQGNSRLRFESARGSLYEAQAGVKIAAAWGYLSVEECAPLLQEMDRLAARVFGVMRK
ncbi:MAG TPA: four helix bundle protein [Polyangiaceae bacterium]|nr:four helix bundle protein [Polyangiaceae bacterium]